ncbi:protein O-mannosyl-transferase TMTC1-like [Planococcus citri]|uniref:protein O-mannosyl-transferase TMTC1-like n=1 Tax=Planococcus citri TaxID=170843 RepID=UPI0031F95353
MKQQHHHHHHHHTSNSNTNGSSYHQHHQHHHNHNQHKSSTSTSKSSMLFLYAVVTVISVCCYLNSLNGDFVHDDIPAISLNPDVIGTTSFSQMCKNDFWGTPMSDVNSHKSYRPLTVFTFRFNNWLFGLHPFWFHFANVVLHALCSGLFTRIAFVIAGLQIQFAALAGAMFASHPIHTEAVAGIVGRADVLACFFFILSFLTYHDYKWRCNRRIFISCAFAGASLLAKETGMTVLIVNLLYDAYNSWSSIKRAITEWKCNDESILFCKRVAILSIVIIILITLRLALLQGNLPKFSNQDNPAAHHPLLTVRFLTYSYLTAFNFWLLLFPFTLSHDWQMGSIPLITNLLDHRNAFTCLFLIFCCWTVYRILADFEHPRSAPIIVGFLFLVMPFLPASNLLFTVGFVVAERVLYIPSMGMILLVVYGGQILSHKVTVVFQKNWPITISFTILLVLFVCKTMHRNMDWKSRESLIRSGLQVVPNNAKMHYNWANYLREKGQEELSIRHYEEALRLWPTYASAYNNLGTLMKSPIQAESHFLSAIKYSPNHVNAHYNLGQVYRKMNQTEMAIIMLKKCLQLNANYISAYILLAKLYDGNTAGNLLKYVVKLHPTNANYFAYYAHWLHQHHRLHEAVFYYKKALNVCATHENSVTGLAHVFRDMGYLWRLRQLFDRLKMSRETRDESSRRNNGDGDGDGALIGDDTRLRLATWDRYKQGQETMFSKTYDRDRDRRNANIFSCNTVELRPVFLPNENDEMKTSAMSTSPDDLPSSFDVAADNGYINSG